MSRQHSASIVLTAFDEQTNALLIDVVDVFTADPMRVAGAAAIARECRAGTEATANTLQFLEALGILETSADHAENEPVYRLRVASTFLEVLERFTAVYTERVDAVQASSTDLSVLRSLVAGLEAKNALLSRKTTELSFLYDAETLVGATLDEGAIAQAVIESVAAATNGKAKKWFLVVRDGNALVYRGGVGIDRKQAEEFVAAHHGALERSLRTGELESAPRSYVAVPIPAGAHDPGFGSIAVVDAEEDGLGGTEIRRLLLLAEIAGRSLVKAQAFSSTLVAGLTDELTGVYNRRYLERRLGEELKRARRLGERAALILLDLDFFKAVNDEYGHPEGDRMLRAIAQAIFASVRDIDVVTRWGGEEFAVILPGTDGPEAVAIAERVRESVALMRLRTAGGITIQITVSCGVAWAAPHIHTPAQCVAAADSCLLEAKRSGRNRTIAMS